MTSLVPGRVAVVLPAAGSGSRFGEQDNKLFASFAGLPLWTHAAERLLARSEVGGVYLVVSGTDGERFESQVTQLTRPDKIRLIIGGDQRSDSVAAAVAAIGDDTDTSIAWVAIHDAARPLVRDTDLNNVFACAAQTKAAILATPITGTIKHGNHQHTSCQTIDRRNMWQAQTPQVFALDLIELDLIPFEFRLTHGAARFEKLLFGCDQAFQQGEVFPGGVDLAVVFPNAFAALNFQLLKLVVELDQQVFFHQVLTGFDGNGRDDAVEGQTQIDIVDRINDAGRGKVVRGRIGLGRRSRCDRETD